MGDFAIEFLEQQSKDKPFYLLVPFYAPHTPFNYQPDVYKEPFKDAKFSCFPDTPKHMWQNPGLGNNHGKRASKLAYSALINGMDHNVGRILKRLEELGMRGDTLVIFTADQGWNAGHHGVWGKGNGTWPLNMYEEAIRVPLIWNHPARIAKGKVAEQMVSSYDYFPTILDYLGVPAPPPSAKRPGRSYAGIVSGRETKWQNRLYFEYEFVRGLRTETLKYVERTAEWPSELFDLEADPGERNNVIDDPAYAKLLAGLRADLAQFFRNQGAPALADWRSTTKQHLTVYRSAKPKTP